MRRCIVGLACMQVRKVATELVDPEGLLLATAALRSGSAQYQVSSLYCEGNISGGTGGNRGGRAMCRKRGAGSVVVGRKG